MPEYLEYINKVKNKKDLNEQESFALFNQIFLGKVAETELKEFLIALSDKGEVVAEILGAVKSLRSHMEKFSLPQHNILDVCGTGGDNSHSLNISTAVAFVLAALDVPVAKHGNSSVSSLSGSADVLKQLGVNINAGPQIMQKILKELNICFLFAPLYHTAMKNVADIRKTLGRRTIFNIIGPLCNPALPNYQLIGVYEKRLLKLLAEVLLALNIKKAWIVHGFDGVDELSIANKSYVTEVALGKINEFILDPQEYSLTSFSLNEIKGKDVSYNANELKLLLAGKGNIAYREIVILNAAASLYITGKVVDLKAGIDLARNILFSKQPLAILEKFIILSNATNV